jgi:hypothetical protein
MRVVESNGDAGLLAESPATPTQLLGFEGADWVGGLLLGHTVSGYKTPILRVLAPGRPP